VHQHLCHKKISGTLEPWSLPHVTMPNLVTLGQMLYMNEEVPKIWGALGPHPWDGGVADP